MVSDEGKLEDELIAKLRDLKYEHRPDIRDRAALEANFRQKFEALNQVKLTSAEFTRLVDEIVTPDTFTAARTLPDRSAFPRYNSTPRENDLCICMLVNIDDWRENNLTTTGALGRKNDGPR